MKQTLRLATLLTSLLLNSCSPLPSKTPAASTPHPNNYQAVYLTGGNGVLSAQDLNAHPQVIVATTFSDFKSQAGSRIALWVDKSAVDLVKAGWLNQPPQKYYPLVLVGYNNALYSFRDTLSVGRIQGPYVDWSKEVLEPGFSVWMILSESQNSESTLMRGYQQSPTVQDILDVTNPLLNEDQEIQPEK
jgi:hypothetical protein